MAVKKKKRSRAHKHYAGQEGGDVVELSERLAPLEEKDARSEQKVSHPDDTIIVDTGKLKLPQSVLQKEKEAARTFGLEPVILVILLIMLAFIAIIAYIVSQMPAPVQ